MQISALAQRLREMAGEGEEAEVCSILERDFLVITLIHTAMCQPASRWPEDDVSLLVQFNHVLFLPPPLLADIWRVCYDTKYWMLVSTKYEPRIGGML